MTLEGWQYAALANWVKGVKLDISAATMTLTALVSRSLSATSGIPGSGIAPTEAKSSAAARKKTEVVKKKDDSILDGYLKRRNERNNERRTDEGERANHGMNERTRR
jgi:hypothetical protein